MKASTGRTERLASFICGTFEVRITRSCSKTSLPETPTKDLLAVADFCVIHTRNNSETNNLSFVIFVGVISPGMMPRVNVRYG